MADVANHIKGNLVKLEIATNPDATTPTYKTVVCGEDVGLDASKDVTTRRTKCGVIKTAGDASWTATGSGVANHTPGSGEMSADEMAAVMQGDTDVLFRMVHEVDGALYYRQGRGIMTAYGESAGVDDPLEFDFTLEVSGNLILVEPA